MTTRTPHPRTDRNTSAIVEQAIAALPRVGLRQAAEFLAAMRVAPRVAVRTLVYPGRRRAS
ncbi:hypothetical protein [Pseudoduganella sp. GCM10020061]|jgi:hypothetical protein|uniref:hypothetical protein n=1 Tax=Pseudoduganella sp. GCM10020061 TaxID=3317345 RepID=UPI0036267547